MKNIRALMIFLLVAGLNFSMISCRETTEEDHDNMEMQHEEMENDGMEMEHDEKMNHDDEHEHSH